MISYFRIIISKLKKSYVLNKYNDFTIAEYFRSQGAKIGHNNRLEVQSLGPEPYLISIGNHCTVAGNVSFVTHDGGVWVFSEEIPDLQKFGPITIHDNCFIGMNSIIMGNVTIGPNAIVGAGSIVTRDVPENSIVAGNPARPVSTLDAYREKVVKIWEVQKPEGYFHGVGNDQKLTPEQIQRLKFRDIGLLRKHLTRLFAEKTN